MANVHINSAAYDRLKAEVRQKVKQEAEKVAQAARAGAPKDTGQLAASIKVEQQGDTTKVVADTPYASAVHQGSRPHNVWPQDRLEGWAGRRGFRTFAIAYHIQNFGTKANPFLEKAFKSVWRLGHRIR